MHCVFDMSASGHGSTGKLWLGGEYASTDLSLLEHNGISVILPASRKPTPADSLNVVVLDCVDGTGLVSGDFRLDNFLAVADQVVQYLLEGRSVLVCCKNGAHRSATLTCAILMRMTGWSFKRAEVYCSTLRNIMDLNSLPPANSRRRQPTRPSEWLADNEGAILDGASAIDAPSILSPVNFRRLAMKLGFEVNKPMQTRAKSRASPGARKTSSGYSSYEMVTDRDRVLGWSSDPGFSTVSSYEAGSSLESDDAPGATPKKKAKQEDGTAVPAAEQVEKAEPEKVPVPEPANPPSWKALPVEPPVEPPAAPAEVVLGFEMVKDELNTPQARQTKVKALVAELEGLNAKMLGLLQPKAEVKAEAAPAPAEAAGTASEAKLDTEAEPGSTEAGPDADMAGTLASFFFDVAVLLLFLFGLCLPHVLLGSL